MKTQIKTARIFILEKMSDFGLFLNSANGFKFLIVSVFLFTFSFYLFTFTGCGKNSTSPQTVTFSGKVTLEGETDHSGVKVSLYKPVELDTALVRINRQYPNIGVQISQETEFDHREHTPVYTTLTDANGNWKIENVVAGEYNVVAEKEGFGWQYKLEVQGGKVDFYLSAVILQKGVLSGNIIWRDGKTYLLEGDVKIAAGAILTLENNVWCLAKSNSRLIIEGNVERNGEGFAFFVPQNLEDRWRGIVLNSPNNTMRNVIIKLSNYGIVVKNNNIILKYIIVKNSNSSGISITKNITNCRISNFILLNNNTGFDYLSADSTSTIEKTIILNSINEGIFLARSKAKIKNNLISNNNIGIRCFELSDAIISNNIIEKNNESGIEIAGSSPVLRNNTLINNNGPTIFISPRGYSKPSQPIIYYNNIISSNEFLVKIVGNSANNNGLDVNAQHNWWGSTDINYILDNIFDKNDLDPNDPNYTYTGKIIVIPFETKFIESAGL